MAEADADDTEIFLSLTLRVEPLASLHNGLLQLVGVVGFMPI